MEKGWSGGLFHFTYNDQAVIKRRGKISFIKQVRPFNALDLSPSKPLIKQVQGGPAVGKFNLE